jgi:hypothetical protein
LKPSLAQVSKKIGISHVVDFTERLRKLVCSIFAYLHMAVEIFFSGALPAQLARKVDRFVCIQAQMMEVFNVGICCK